MKLIDMLLRVDKTRSLDVDPDPLFEEFGLCFGGSYDAFRSRVKVYPLFQWLCTDSHVGLTVVYLDDMLVAQGFQPYRKSPVEYRFVSADKAERLREFLVTLLEDRGPVLNVFTCEDLEAEVEPFGAVEFNGQLLGDTGFYEDKPVKVVERFRGSMGINNVVTVETMDGTRKKIPVRELKLPFRLSPEPEDIEPLQD